jgi:hypothetical protein
MSGLSRDDIIRMAREAEFCDASELDLNVEWTCSFSELQHFVGLVAAAEREACAELCETLRLFHCDDIGYSELPYKKCAFNIRERGAP